MGGMAKCLAVFGSGSEVGKSVVAAALCRIIARRGLKVAPFKAQNMSNNSCVTPEGLEIGRAQGVQAECARAVPSVHMNPLLLKPHGNNRSQTVLLGRVAGETSAADFRAEKKHLFSTLMQSLDILRKEHDAVVIEGAGSCAEVNLRDWDMANFRTALHCNAPVLLVTDISRGGVFAQAVGTVNLLRPEERALVKGIIVNRFKGDLSLFSDGVKFIERETGIPALGVVPHFSGIDIDQEDSVVLEEIVDPPDPFAGDKINIGVVRLPHISNFTDFAPLGRSAAVNLAFLRRPRPLNGADLLIIPGSKNTRADLQWLRETGWEKEIKTFAAKGGRIAGICGGFQMLGVSVIDEHGVEGAVGETEGLALLPVSTTLADEKKVGRVTARWVEGGYPLSGYEIHMGVTNMALDVRSPVEILSGNGGRPDGAVSSDGRIFGTYMHGLFDEPGFRKHFLRMVGGDKYVEAEGDDKNPVAYSDAQYDLLADHFEKHLATDAILAFAGLLKA